ncbi:hypothetical protein [Nostoc sp. TCL240-02]|uniref:hypothetical protein n=1 Tax=Nostoc sp. TCL240-02 TaxID=2572090 RepID=UPI00157FA72A|nr:hypothetical protein [Nostoc sp. TCL240-02]QKQ75211.1 hypothetical protein FBB35_19640 [Nostoc sp. TCL240-02]
MGNLENYPVFEITVTEEDGSFYESFITYVDGDLFQCLKILDYPEDWEIDTEELSKDTPDVKWYLCESQMIELN